MTDTTVPAALLLPPSACREIAGWLAAADIDAIDIDAPGLRLRMVRGPDGYCVDAGEGQASGPGAAAVGATATAVAPCAGIFLERHPAGGDCVRQYGAQVGAGELVGLLQIGLLLVPVLAPVAGTVGHALIAPGTLAGYGTPLVDIVVGDA